MRAVKWFLTNGTALFCAWNGIVNNNSISMNIFAFITWFVFVVSVLIILVHKSVRKNMKNKNRSVPAIISAISDIALVLLCAAHGYFFYATAWLISLIAESAVYDNHETTKE